MVAYIAHNTFMRKARKSYPCQCHLREFHGASPDDSRGLFCETRIEPGDQYVESVDSAPAYQSGDRYCVPCGSHQGLLAYGSQPLRHKYTCRLPYIEQRRSLPGGCACGGMLDDWYDPLVAS